MQNRVAYLNGEWIRDSELRIGVDDVGFLVGATSTERVRTFHGEVFRLDQHLIRLRGSLQIMGLDGEAIVSEVGNAVPEFLRRNNGLIDPADDWAIVVFVTPGSPGNGRPTVCVHGFPLPFRQWSAKFETGVSVAVSQHRQVPTNCWPAELKCRSRMHYYLADREAGALEPGARAIVLDQDGFVAEATTANVIVYREGEGVVSPPQDSILFGVSLGVVKELTATIGEPFVMRQLTVDDLSTADEAMLASTSICMQPIVTCNGKPIGSGWPGPIYRKLLAAWSALVETDIAEQARRFADRV